MKLRIKRAYETPAAEDGYRILVDRLWPRGLTKEKARIDLWLKDIAPSNELRKWFAHDPDKWPAFKAKYLQELKSKNEALSELHSKLKEGAVTLIYAARDEQHNEAVILQELIARKSNR